LHTVILVREDNNNDKKKEKLEEKKLQTIEESVGWQVCDNDFGEINNKTHMKNDASFVLPTQNGKQGYSSSSCGIQETRTKNKNTVGI